MEVWKIGGATGWDVVSSDTLPASQAAKSSAALSMPGLRIRPDGERHQLHQIAERQPGPNASPRRRRAAIDPGVPGALEIRLAADVVENGQHEEEPTLVESIGDDTAPREEPEDPVELAKNEAIERAQQSAQAAEASVIKLLLLG